jgi:hypothetical protein
VDPREEICTANKKKLAATGKNVHNKKNYNFLLERKHNFCNISLVVKIFSLRNS